MSSERDHRQTLHRMTRAFNERDRETWCAAFADPCVFHHGDEPRERSHDAHWDSLRTHFDVFPDLTSTLESAIVEGDRAFARWTYTGTHLGTSTSGIEPTGKRIDFGTVFAEYRFEDGVIAEAWEVSRFAKVGEA